MPGLPVDDGFAALKDLKGEFIWVNGSLNSGKTSLCLDLAVQALASGNTVLYLQNPEQLSMDMVQETAKVKELVIDDEDFLLAGPDDLSHALVLLEEGISLDPVMIIIDSLDRLVTSGIDDVIDEKTRLLEFLSILKQFTIQDKGVVFVTTSTEQADHWFISLLEKFETCMVEVKIETINGSPSRQLIFLRDNDIPAKNLLGQKDSRIDKTSSSRDLI
ncbi:MAG: hypothetical protein ACFFD4_34705 [Candidatus Odinarchaeota archaeon]